ncbi:uncharacterized protein LOC108913755 isoform X2 [Anoplophora glabripennis]|uniref:uncharacterized protein LOC108913755 isoform X2 n=1 Tax=Anoplophora glabripennis TaxID=217634 RepID=UPI000874AE3B|nr:uncharacterized protein LOC108913755 isoform X2 [Anoplophora glabripennis]
MKILKDGFDFGQTAFSPTELDDSFMFHYRPQAQGGVDSKKLGTPGLQDNITASQVNNAKVDLSRHPPPCQKYLQNINDASPPQVTPEMKIKSSGTDDGFKGEAAKCGSSIIRVASQMVSGKMVHGFTIKEDTKCDKDQASTEHYDLMKRRGSKSLPATPLASPSTSPKAGRRAMNKYFTAAFTDTEKAKGGWILSNLLARRDLSQSVGFINEETKEELERSASTASIDELSTSRNKTNVFKAKPSELREMNFWSPTSM